MTNDPTGLLLVVGFLVAAVGAVPLSALAFLLARRVRPFSRALTYVGAGVTAVVAALAFAVAAITPEASLLVAGVATTFALVLWVGPLVVARWVLVRRGVDAERALRRATVGLPVALLASLLVVFGDFDRYNITFLTGVEAVLAWTALALVVLVGPTVVALVLERTRRRTD